MKRIALCSALVLGCGAPAGEGKAPPGPTPQGDDPNLTHTFTMPADKSALAQGDLGSLPETLSDELMTKAGMPGIAHRIVQHCAQKNAFGGDKVFVVRFELGEGGRLTRAVGDPEGDATKCLVAQLQVEAKEPFASLPAGTALLRVQLH